MTELILLLFIGVLLGVLFSLDLLMGGPKRSEEPEAAGTLFEIVSLPGLGFRHAAMLFDDSDYRSMRRVPALKNNAWHLRHDRRRLVLLWLRLLRKDLTSLWRFRRLLTGYGVTSSMGEELRIAAAAIVGLVLLSCLSVFITIAGPFVLTGLLKNARSNVEKLSCSCASLLGRIPSTRWSEIQHAWSGVRAGSPG